jgi:iron complex outermembrane receptor protein
MFKRSQICTAALVALGGTLFSGAVLAQAAERIEVTGSRIKSVGAVSSSPITSITAEEMNVSQPVAVEEVVRGLSASYPGIGPGTNNGSNGTASVDLRGLGTNRTLVLVNGRRIVPATLGGVVDTNSIPVSLIESVELVTGGASAVYGADAVSGVVNFKLKKDFSGVEAGYTYGSSTRGDATRRTGYLTLGSNLADGRGNVVLNIGTTKTDPLKQGERDFSFYQINSITGGRDGSGTASPAQYVGIPGMAGAYVIDYATGALRAATAADNYNFNPPNYFQTPLDRTQFTALGRFTINDFAEAYAELTHTKGRVTLNLAESGTFTSTYSIPIGNPYIPDAMRAQLCTAFGITTNCAVGNTTEVRFRAQRRFTEFGPRINTYDNTTSQWTAGVRGTVPFLSNWSYDGYLQTGKSDQLSARQNWGSFSRVQQALRAVSKTACTVTTNGCVPIDVFGQDGSISQAMLNFINLTAVQTTYVEQKVGNLTLSGDLGAVKSPFAKAPIGLVVGLETREVTAGNVSDQPTQISGEVLGTGAPTPDRSGTLKLNEGYLETIVPLAEGLPGVRSLNLEAGFRETQFKTAASSKSYNSWKLGLDYAPIKGLRFRAMQQRATRAPNVNELYAPVTTGLANLGSDPCQGTNTKASEANTPGTLSYLCAQTGVPTSQLGALGAPSAGQINNTSGGNPNLGPEEADTTTIGFVFEPEFAKGLSVSVDYYNIDIDKAVSSATVAQTVNGCYNSGLNPGFSPSAVFCGFIKRDEFGTLNSGSGVITQSSNLGRYSTSGVDIDVKYRLPLTAVGLSAAAGRVDLGLTASLLSKWEFQSLPTTAPIDCKGYYGLNCGNPYFKTRFTQRATWSGGPFSVGYQWRYFDKVEVEPVTITSTQQWLPAHRTIKAYSYVDLIGSYDITKNFRVSLTVNNAFDKEPPMIGNTIAGTGPNSGNTLPQVYDAIGRYVSVNARMKF